MNLDRFSGAGSTPSRRRFWDKVQSAVMASRKVAGRNITIDEHSGAGSVINAPNRSRTSPPPSECPSTVFVQFSGITFACGCTPFTSALTTAFTIEDEGNVNSLSSTLSLGYHAFPLCGDCPDGDGNGRFWEGSLTIGIIPDLYIDFWNNTDCSGPPDTHHFQELVFPVLILLSGVYYLFAFIQSTDTMIFYATASSLAGPFDNILSCNPSYVTFSDPAITCFNNGSSRDFNVIASGGSAIITSV